MELGAVRGTAQQGSIVPNKVQRSRSSGLNVWDPGMPTEPYSGTTLSYQHRETLSHMHTCSNVQVSVSRKMEITLLLSKSQPD